MSAHFPTLKAQLLTDIRTVIGGTADVQFGRPRRAMTTYPHAVVKSRVTRRNGIRDVQETYIFEIGVKLALPDPYPEDGSDTAVMASAASLMDLLAPFDLSTPPTDSGDYASIGFQRYVTEITPMDTADEDPYVGYVLRFQCTCTVYQ